MISRGLNVLRNPRVKRFGSLVRISPLEIRAVGLFLAFLLGKCLTRTPKLRGRNAVVLGSKREGLAPAGTVAGSTESHFGEVGGVQCKMASQSGLCVARPPQACDNLRATWLPASPRLTGRFDIAMLPSLARVENLAAALAGYGMIVVDECHHVPATSFEMVLKACSSRRVYGLTATPKRKDRLEKLRPRRTAPANAGRCSDR
jgi:hypothetical protein